ncbi:MAG TPA: hypothetical protein VK760_05995, partial [Candidatus Acidoferrales bacterium]|nr:hypothetical protein [Candidatus Acidoferrales bacterium]
MAFTSNLGSTTTYNADLTPATNPNCTPSPIVCTLQIPLTLGSYTGSISTYDGLLDGTKTPTGNELSANQNIAFTLVTGKPNAIGVTLGGIPASISIFPTATSTLTGSAGTGFGLSRCGAGVQQVAAYANDADGNIILGAGAPSMTLKSGSASLAIS